MATFHFELVSPEKLLFSGDVEAVVVPGVEGQFTVMKDHAPVMTVLKAGVVEIDESSSKKSRLFVRGGFADVAGGGLTLLAEQATSSTRRNWRRKSRTPRKTSPTRRRKKPAPSRRKSSTSSRS
jgi:ATP synthase F1 epsilon subunit